MSEKRFKIYQDSIRKFESDRIWGVKSETNSLEPYMTFKEAEKCCDLLNEQQELIEELHISDHMGWGRAEKFEKELKQKKIYIKRLEYKVQKFKEMNYEQQDKITELEKNFDDLVQWASEIAKRNVLLDEKIGRLQQENKELEKGIKRLEKMIWKIQWRFQQEVGIEKAREHYQEIDKEMKE